MTELDIFTYEHSIILEVIYALGFAVIGIIINAVGKLAILCKSTKFIHLCKSFDS